MQYFVGVDIGTTHTKAVMVTATGKVLQEKKAGYPTHQPFPGYSEQDPDQIFTAVLDVLGGVLAFINDKENLTAVCFSAAMHSIMAINEQGRPLTPLYTWADTRSIKYTVELKSTEKGKRIYLETGTPVHPMSPLCKIAWIKNELPEIFQSTHKFISGKEYVFWKLFGKFLIDYSIASATGMFNIRTLRWNDESLEFAGINADYLSQPVSPTHFETSLEEKCRKNVGLEKKLPFFIGSSDGCLAIIGSGATLPNEVALTIGTSAAVRKISDQPLQDIGGGLFSYLLNDKSYVCGGASNNGGIVLKWFAENLLDRPFASNEAFDWFMETAHKSPPGAAGLIFLPYIYGERAPVWDAAARGVFLGINGIHTRAHFARSILEGICFSLYQVTKAIEVSGGAIDTIYASGGFIQSNKWLQILCDIFNKKLIVSLAGDASAIGASFMAMYALGLIKDWDEVKSMTETSAVFHPDSEAHEKYLKNFKVFEKLYDKLKDDFLILSE